MARYYANPATKPHLDVSLYSLDSDETAFFQQLTGIGDEQALRDHIIAVQAKAYNVRPFASHILSPADASLKDLWISVHPSLFLYQVRSTLIHSTIQPTST